MKYAYAGDREISCNILTYIISKGYKPSLLLVNDNTSTTHADKLIEISGLNDDKIIRGKQFTNPENIEKLKALNLDYIIGIHFPLIIPNEVLDCPKIGFLNLHPAYLPYNKGWHTPTWAILDKTTYGATLHFMSEKLDAGDIIHQKALEVNKDDTANSLYERVLKLEEQVFYEALPDILSLNPTRIKQIEQGTSHNRKDLFKINEISLEENIRAGDLIDKLRALTTNRVDEFAYFIHNSKKYALEIKITEKEHEL
ncbi:MAG: hypothetical protein ED556_03075 [Winogradskyella sp.]|uniref:methionyl-tRNA formyltransferase n=1 Tax=Winogradskyella sp. TaxID=1883156 RepID=UPI000F3CF1E0|nr:formyltransferase family protein [Winogradskyella sp.]RNC88182.1 MAG: hypothetical protein ED556_03075 [Winogradskyella sp.]